MILFFFIWLDSRNDKHGKYCQWEEQLMERSVAAYHNEDMNVKVVAKTYCVPKAILKRRMSGRNLQAVEHVQQLGVRCTYLKKSRGT
jgi:hypothetical protein